jgi:hypothetical protein
MHFFNRVHEANLSTEEFLYIHVFHTRNHLVDFDKIGTGVSRLKSSWESFILLHTDKLKTLFCCSPELNLPYQILVSRGCE